MIYGKENRSLKLVKKIISILSRLPTFNFMNWIKSVIQTCFASGLDIEENTIQRTKK